MQLLCSSWSQGGYVHFLFSLCQVLPQEEFLKTAVLTRDLCQTAHLSSLPILSNIIHTFSPSEL